jgi:mannose-6-phosphate isomerase-like protein (cupin superfamily)
MDRHPWEDSMGTTREIPTGEAFELSQETVGLERSTGRAWFMDWGSGGPPRIDGYTVGAPLLTTEPPHAGELHPDADELLYLISGRVRVRLELEGEDRDTELGAGQALIVPRGVWHRIFIDEPGRLVHVTPGPGGQHRPLPEA